MGGTGGAVSMTAGATSADNSKGGNIAMTAGAGSSADGGQGGDAIITGGAGTTTGGSIKLNTGSGTTKGDILMHVASTQVAKFSSTGIQVGGTTCAVLQDVLRGTISVDASTSTIASGAEAEYSVASLTKVSEGDLVFVTPGTAALAGSSLIWSAYAGTNTVNLRITNAHATTAYSGNGNWYYTVFVFSADGDCA